MDARQRLPAALAVLLFAAAAPAWGVEIVVVPAGPPGAGDHAAPAPRPSCAGGSCGHWLQALKPTERCPVCVCIDRECRCPCPPGCLPNSGYHPTHWRYLPTEDVPPREAGAAAGGAPDARQPELLPAPENNRQQPPKGKNGNEPPQNQSEKLPPPDTHPAPNNNGVSYRPVSSSPATLSSYGQRGHFVPASGPR
jgi:hypothetical protein